MEQFSALIEHLDSTSIAPRKRLEIAPIERLVDWREIFMKQSVGKCKQINYM